MDTSPTSLFHSYEQDFQQIISSIREKLDGDAKGDAAGMLTLTLRTKLLTYVCLQNRERPR